jgi:hypothetical protein
MHIPSGEGKVHGNVRSSEESAKLYRMTSPKSGLSEGGINNEPSCLMVSQFTLICNINIRETKHLVLSSAV